MIIFLTSSPSGPLDNSRHVDGFDSMNNFTIKLKEYWKIDSTVLFIMADPYSHEENDEEMNFFAYCMDQLGLSYKRIDIWDSRKKNITAKQMKNYDVVFLGGGHVPTQNKFFTSIGLRKKLKNFKGIVIGISAGTMNCADTVYAQPEEPGEATDPDYKRYLKGLGLTKRMILPHYQMIKKMRLDGKRMYEDIVYPDSYDHTFIALPDGSYILSVDGVETLYGEAYLISEGKKTKIFNTLPEEDI